MTLKKGDAVIWRGRPSKVMAHPTAEGVVTLHVGQGQIVREVGPSDYTLVSFPTEPTIVPGPKPAPKPKSKPIAKARRQVGTGKGKGK